ncbi:MAG: hypothetical protein V3S69_02935 [Dehalococcoidales bacterium]
MPSTSLELKSSECPYNSGLKQVVLAREKMRKSLFKRLVDMLKKRDRGFKKLVDNPSGTKFRNLCKKDSNRGADGTMR